MYKLSFLSGLTSADWAAWVQAFGTILAVVGAAFAVIWESKRQYANSLRLQAEERRFARLELTKTLLELSRNCGKVFAHIIQLIDNNRDTVHAIAYGDKHLDVGELARVEQAVSGIPLHSLPAKLVAHTMIVSSIVRQFRAKIQDALHHHRTMDASAFEDLFRSIAEMKASLSATCTDIQNELHALEEGGA